MFLVIVRMPLSFPPAFNELHQFRQSIYRSKAGIITAKIPGRLCGGWLTPHQWLSFIGPFRPFGIPYWGYILSQKFPAFNHRTIPQNNNFMGSIYQFQEKIWPIRQKKSGTGQPAEGSIPAWKLPFPSSRLFP